jgi:hypothetical protein
VHDEVTVYLLEGSSEVAVRHRRVDREVCRQVGAVVCRRDRVLVFPGLAAFQAERLGKPLCRAVEHGLGRNVEDRLLETRGKLGHGEGRWARIAECIKTCGVVAFFVRRYLIDRVQRTEIGGAEEGKRVLNEAIVLRVSVNVGIGKRRSIIRVVLRTLELIGLVVVKHETTHPHKNTSSVDITGQELLRWTI